MVRTAVRVAEAAHSHGGVFAFESPVDRGRGSPFAIAGREEHVPMWSDPLMRDFARRHGEAFVFFDQCRLGAETQKTTALLVSRKLHPLASKLLGELKCNHITPPGKRAPASQQRPAKRELSNEHHSCHV